MLFLFTGSVVLPVKAVIMNALSLSAVFGILVLIFQDGNLAGPARLQSQGALDATQPIFLAAVAFGLATDYGVFLLSRIKEARDGGASDSEAVASDSSGRVASSPPPRCCSRSRSARSPPPSSCSSRNSASGPRSRS